MYGDGFIVFSFVVLCYQFPMIPVTCLYFLLYDCPSTREVTQKDMGTIKYHKTSSISHTLVDNKIIDHSDVVGASPVGAAPTTSSFST